MNKILLEYKEKLQHQKSINQNKHEFKILLTKKFRSIIINYR